LSPLANIRNDAYGGDAKRRMTFLLNIVHETRKKIGPNAILSVKLNSADFQKGGFSQEDSLEVIVELEKAGVDLLEISGGNYESPAMVGIVKPSTQKREAYFVEFAAKVRERSKIPLMLSGGVRTLEFANQVINNKEVDIIGIARPFAIAPDAGAILTSNQSLKNLPMVRSSGLALVDAYIQIAWHGLLLGDISQKSIPNTTTLNPLIILSKAIVIVSFRSATQFAENDWKWAMITLAGLGAACASFL